MNDPDLDEAFQANRTRWNELTPVHLASKMYDVPSFVAGRNSLSSMELALLGDVKGKHILHLQCHFGQDTLSLARMGATVTGLDLSDVALDAARELSKQCALEAEWVLANVLDPQPQLVGRFDTVFTSFGTIGWLPELHTWARNIRSYLKPGGRLVFVEFHPVVWMFDTEFKTVHYSYFNREPIVEIEKGSYADKDADLEQKTVSWNHDLGEVLGALLAEGFRIDVFQEFDGSPHDCFQGTVQGSDGLYRIAGMEGKLPMVYALSAVACEGKPC